MSPVATELRRRFDEAHAQNPALPPPDPPLVHRIAQRLERTGDSPDTIHYGDLLLAEGCARGDAACVALFERTVMAKVKVALLKVDSTPGFVEEVTQQVRTRLLASADGECRMRQYTGDGPLANWARVTAVRLAINMKHAEARADHSGEAEPKLPASALTPELALMREQLKDKFNLALAEALNALSAQDRTLLRLHLVDHLSFQQVGLILGTNKSTAFRRLSRLEDELVRRTREVLRTRFGIRDRELESAMRAFSDRVPLDVKALLRADLDPG